MNRRTAALAIACASWTWAWLAVLAPIPAGAAEPGIELQGLDATEYPEVSFEVTGAPLQGDDIPAAAFFVAEQGNRVDVRVERMIDHTLDVMVVVDASGSMAGAPIEGARQAASAFIRGLPEGARVGVVGFGASPVLLHPLSSTRPEQLAAVAGLEPRGETALHDALVLTGRQLDGSTAAHRAVVVLSDGGDTVSTASFGDAMRALQDTGASVSVVELTTGETDHDALALLADGTGGMLVGASDAGALLTAFDAVRADLAGRYVVRFTSDHGGPTNLVVSVATPSGVFTTRHTFTFPGPVPSAKPALTQAVETTVGDPGLLARPIVRTVGIGALSAGLAIAAAALFLPVRRTIRLVDRRRPGQTRGGVASLADLTARATGVAERALEHRQRRTTLDRLLEQGGVTMRAGELVVLVVVSSAAACAVALPLGGVLLSIIAAPLPALVAHTLLTRRRRRRQEAFAEQLEEIVQFLAGSLRAGYAFLQALESASHELPAPASDELRRVSTEIRLGRDLTDALDAMGERVGSTDFGWVIQAVRIHREVGGDLADVLDRVAETIRSRASIHRQVRALSAEGRISAYVLLALPPGVAAMLALVNRPYFAELTNNSLGIAMVAAAAVMVALGGLWIRRLIQLVY